MKFSPLPCYLVPLRPKYFPQHPTLKHLQPNFLLLCQFHTRDHCLHVGGNYFEGDGGR
jgi:hypothetical protein